MFTTTQGLALLNETAVFDGNFIDYYKVDKNLWFYWLRETIIGLAHPWENKPTQTNYKDIIGFCLKKKKKKKNQ